MWASEEYIALHKIIQSLDAKQQCLQSRQSIYHTVPSLVEETVEELTPVLDFVICLDNFCDEDEQDHLLFEQNFCLGPFGLAPAIDYLHFLSILFLEQYKQGLVTPSDTLGCFNKFDALVTPLLSLVLAFCSRTPQTQYDPPGFSDL